MPSPPDRPIDPVEVPKAEFPFPPKNISINSGYLPSTYDIHWTDPAEVQPNAGYRILGVNIYRSFDAPYSRLEKLTPVPQGGSFYRNSLASRLVLNENVSSSYLTKANTSPNRSFIFETRFKPLDIFVPLGKQDDLHLAVYVTVNGVPARVSFIDGERGQVTLDPNLVIDTVANRTYPAVVPKIDSDTTMVSYRYIQDNFSTSLASRIYYHITSVGIDNSNGRVVETPLERSYTVKNLEVEPLNYIWREAIRRNRWILDQSGERVKLFIRRNNGPQCGCYSIEHAQAKSDCLTCYGTGIIGGYDGPFDYLMSPDDGSKSITQSNFGRTNNHTYEVWGPPMPIINQRDFMIKSNGDRYGFSGVRSPSSRGMQLQQFFTVSYLDLSDIRHRVPVLDTVRLKFPETRYIKTNQGMAVPMMTNSGLIPSEIQYRGSTVASENEFRRG